MWLYTACPFSSLTVPAPFFIFHPSPSASSVTDLLSLPISSGVSQFFIRNPVSRYQINFSRFPDGSPQKRHYEDTIQKNPSHFGDTVEIPSCILSFVFAYTKLAFTWYTLQLLYAASQVIVIVSFYQRYCIYSVSLISLHGVCEFEYVNKFFEKLVFVYWPMSLKYKAASICGNAQECAVTR